MNKAAHFFVLTCLFAGIGMAQDAQVTSLMSKDLPEFAGKEATMISVVYPPGAKDPVHRHHAHAFLYVLEGTVVMQLNNGREVRLQPGQTFYEGPNDVHTVGRNESDTQPAKFIVVLVKDKGAPVLEPVEPSHSDTPALPAHQLGENKKQDRD